jgi:hypothetical protein
MGSGFQFVASLFLQVPDRRPHEDFHIAAIRLDIVPFYLTIDTAESTWKSFTCPMFLYSRIIGELICSSLFKNRVYEGQGFAESNFFTYSNIMTKNFMKLSL